MFMLITGETEVLGACLSWMHDSQISVKDMKMGFNIQNISLFKFQR